MMITTSVFFIFRCIARLNSNGLNISQPTEVSLSESTYLTIRSVGAVGSERALSSSFSSVAFVCALQTTRTHPESTGRTSSTIFVRSGESWSRNWRIIDNWGEKGRNPLGSTWFQVRTPFDDQTSITVHRWIDTFIRISCPIPSRTFEIGSWRSWREKTCFDDDNRSIFPSSTSVRIQAQLHCYCSVKTRNTLAFSRQRLGCNSGWSLFPQSTQSIRRHLYSTWEKRP